MATTVGRCFGNSIEVSQGKGECSFGCSISDWGSSCRSKKQWHKTLGMEEYTLQQSIEIYDNVVVLPTSHEQTLQLYQEGKERHCRCARKCFRQMEQRLNIDGIQLLYLFLKSYLFETETLPTRVHLSGML
mmetsp:Transcript_16049/g.34709  ORF Transcript_16049/g.34709 Transcript_16049/m.34709 type:complete len:131 (-) Transcript_16049:318-710(-)